MADVEAWKSCDPKHLLIGSFAAFEINAAPAFQTKAWKISQRFPSVRAAFRENIKVVCLTRTPCMANREAKTLKGRGAVAVPRCCAVPNNNVGKEACGFSARAVSGCQSEGELHRAVSAVLCTWLEQLIRVANSRGAAHDDNQQVKTNNQIKHPNGLA
mgnify:CR=1 FL=1